MVALGHAVVVLGVCGAWLPATVVFALSWLLVVLRPPPGARWRPAWGWASAVLLLGAFLLLRDTAKVQSVLGPWSVQAMATVGISAAHPLRFLGLSYCVLRSAYALLDERQWDLGSLANYWFFAPTFLSGPIVTPAGHFRPIVGARRSLLEAGAARVLSGLVRVALALVLSNVIPLSTRYSFAAATHTWPLGALWLGLFASGVWLYLDFSGYSEIFIGIARMCGVRAPENFDHPLSATNLTAFWQRWHMSLGDWLRACVYDPISRSFLRASTGLLLAASLVAPVVTMLVCGAWHASASAYVAWGLFHGLGLAFHATWVRFAAPRLPAAARGHRAYRSASWLATQGYVAAAWILFLPTTMDVTFSDRLRALLRLVGAA